MTQPLMDKDKLVFGMKLKISKAIPDGVVLLVSPPRGPADRRTDAERAVMIDTRAAALRSHAQKEEG